MGNKALKLEEMSYIHYSVFKCSVHTWNPDEKKEEKKKKRFGGCKKLLQNLE